MAVSVHQRSPWRARGGRWIAAAVIVAAATAYAVYQGFEGRSQASTAAEGEPALVEHVEGTDVARVTLSATAIKRLDLRTVPARSVLVRGKQRTVVPYGAILYDPNGETWIYTSPKPRTFTRERIAVDSIDGTRAVLSVAPATGTPIVRVGTQELWGAELGIDGSGH